MLNYSPVWGVLKILSPPLHEYTIHVRKYEEMHKIQHIQLFYYTFLLAQQCLFQEEKAVVSCCWFYKRDAEFVELTPQKL
jgi:hypothetical protein